MRGAVARLVGRFSRRTLVVTAVLLVVLASAGYAYAGHSNTAVTYRTATAALGTVTQTLGMSGNLSPVGETDVTFLASGRVNAVSVTAGQSVVAGQTLATLDTSTLQSQLQQAQNTLTSAQAKLQLDEAGPTAQNLEQAQGQISTAQVALSNAETSYNDTVAVNNATLAQDQTT